MYTCYLPGRLLEGLYESFRLFSDESGYFISRSPRCKAYNTYNPIRELKIKKPKHENLIFFLNLDITPTSPTFGKLDEMK